ncbi:MAG: hypothetical protein JOZ13_17915 [Alphaproteobacteria bacterium]|nr:hypothetical protein [Alphaproteobacteria bacterium]
MAAMPRFSANRRRRAGRSRKTARRMALRPMLLFLLICAAAALTAYLLEAILRGDIAHL